MNHAIIANRLGAFVAQTRFEDLPTDVVEKGKRHILDTFGAALAGAMSEEANRAKATLLASEPAGPAPVWGTADAMSPRNAAFLNGIAAHAFELDDTGGCDHSGAVVLPAAVAALSLADAPVPGRVFLTAVVVGYDLGRRALEGFGGYRSHNEVGWHSTGTCGTFGAAAATANLLNLTAAETMSCLGLAGSFSSGLWAFIHDGAMSKRIHAGRAAEGGLTATLLARGGITGPAHVFEDVWGGFLKTYSHAATDPGALTRDLGRSWRIMRCAIKPYASCRDTHAAVDAVGRILARHPVHPDDVSAVRARLNPFLAGMVGGREFATLPAAQMNLRYAVAVRILFGTAGLSAYLTDRRADKGLGALMQRISIDIDESVVASDRAMVTLITRDGRHIEEPTTTARGAPENPLADSEVLAKFRELAGYALPHAQARELADAVLALDAVPDATVLLTLLDRPDAEGRPRRRLR